MTNEDWEKAKGEICVKCGQEELKVAKLCPSCYSELLEASLQGYNVKSHNAVAHANQDPNFFPIDGDGQPGANWELVDTYDFRHRTTQIYHNRVTDEKRAHDILK